MANRWVLSAIGIAAVATVGLATGLSAKTQFQRQTPATLDDLLSEVKGLRADIGQSSAATIKTQLLVARLQVEEQRINGIAKQIADVEQQLAPIRQSIAMMTPDLKRLDDARRSANNDPDLSDRIEQIKTGLDTHQRRERELAGQEANLAQQYALEQSRWSEFNDRLDALERSLTTR